LDPVEDSRSTRRGLCTPYVILTRQIVSQHSSQSVGQSSGRSRAIKEELLKQCKENHRIAKMSFVMEAKPPGSEAKALAEKELRETDENIKKGIETLRKLVEG